MIDTAKMTGEEFLNWLHGVKKIEKLEWVVHGETLDADEVSILITADTLSEEYAGNLIEEAVSALPDARAGEVIRKCFWENKPLHEVGEQLDISRERVRQIQYKALKRLKIDRRIKEAAEIYGYGSGQAYHWGVGRWKDTGYSSTEFLAIKRIETSDRLKQHLEDTCELNTAIPIIADGVRNRNDGYTPSGIRKLEELNREMDQLIQNRLAERKRIAANG